MLVIGVCAAVYTAGFWSIFYDRAGRAFGMALAITLTAYLVAMDLGRAPLLPGWPLHPYYEMRFGR